MPEYISDCVPENAVIAPYLIPIEEADNLFDPVRPTPTTIPPLPIRLADIERRTVIGDESGYPIGVGALVDCPGAKPVPHGKWHYIIYTDATYPDLKEKSHGTGKINRNWYWGVLDIVSFPQHQLYGFFTKAQTVQTKRDATDLLSIYMPEGIAVQVLHYAVRATTQKRIGTLEKVVKAKLAAEGRTLEPDIDGDWSPVPIVNLGKTVEAVVAFKEVAYFADEWIATGWVLHAPGHITPAVFIIPSDFTYAAIRVKPYMLYQWNIVSANTAIIQSLGEDLHKDAAPVVPTLRNAVIIATKFRLPGAYTPPPMTSNEWVVFRVKNAL